MKTKVIVAVSIGLLGSELVWQIWKYVKKLHSRNHAQDKAANKERVGDKNEVLMFTDDGKLCREHANTRIACGKSCPVEKVKRIELYLRNAIKTLDVCIYMITCEDLTEAIVNAHRQGARVRLIADSGMGEHPACNKQMLRMRRVGIKVRMNKVEAASLMHHKFAIIDERIVLFGSTNWTMQAFYGNNDSIVITDNRKCVQAYSDEFDKMWRNFDLGQSECDLQVKN